MTKSALAGQFIILLPHRVVRVGRKVRAIERQQQEERDELGGRARGDTFASGSSRTRLNGNEDLPGALAGPTIIQSSLAERTPFSSREL